jgi:hypothetical protein
MPSWIEFRIGSQGLFRLALFDRAFLACFDRSAAGAIRSFGLALPLLPLFLWLVWLNIDQPLPSVPLYLTAKAVAYAYSWILFPFVILAAARLLEREQDAAGCITIYNWSSVLWMFLQLPISLLGALQVAPDVAGLLNLAIFIASLVIEGFLFIVSLRVVLWQAAVLVAIDVVLSQMVIWPISDWLGGMPAG